MKENGKSIRQKSYFEAAPNFFIKWEKMGKEM